MNYRAKENGLLCDAFIWRTLDKSNRSKMRWNMINPVAFEIGLFAIRWYALCIVWLLALAVYLTWKKLLKENSIRWYFGFILIAFPVAILGARLYYVLFRLDYYLQKSRWNHRQLEWWLAIYGVW